MPACTLSRAPLSCSIGRTRRSVVLRPATHPLTSVSVHWPNLPLNVGRALLLLLSALAAQDALFTRRWDTGRPRRTGAARLRRGALRERVAHAIVGGEHGEQRRAACVGSAAFLPVCPSFPGTWMAVCLRQSAQGTLSRCAFHEPSAASWVVSLHAASVAKRRRRAARLPREPSEHEARVLPASALAPERAAPPLQARATCFIFGSATRPGRCHQKHEQLQWRTRPI